jgi:hypothetical protein
MRKPVILTSAFIFLCQPLEAKCRVTRIETDVNAIRLGDEDSVQRVLGDTQKLPIGANQKKPEESDTPELVLFNKDRTEQAALTQYPGAVHGSFSVIEVGKANPALIGKTLEVDHLSTERGIRLGVSESFVSGLLGSCYTRRVTRSGETTFAYETADMNHPFLKRVGMPNYFGRYRFREGKLVSFELGSDYP